MRFSTVVLFSHFHPFNVSAPVTVNDCTANQDADCAANTDGNTVCVNNVCSGKLNN